MTTDQKEELVLAHMSLVNGIARRIARRVPFWIELDDLVGMGTLGLIDAVQRWDGREVTRLTFFATRIRGSIIDGLRDLDPMSRGARRVSTEIGIARSMAAQALKREPSREEIVEYMGLDKSASEKSEYWEPLLEVSFEVFWDERLTVSPVEEDFESEERARLISAAVANLPPRERRVVELYYYDELNLGQVAERIGGVESLASQILTRALKRLRKELQGRIES